MMSVRTFHPLFLTVVALLAALASLSSSAQEDRDDVYFDWPVGQCQDARLIPGHGYYVQQDFANRYNNISCRCGATWCSDPPEIIYQCYHAGLDMTVRDNHGAAVGEPVFAAADGRVHRLTDWGGSGEAANNQGYGVVLVHDLANGETRYTQYVHLLSRFVAKGEVVRRGQPIGTIVKWPGDEEGEVDGNSHLHFELHSSDGVRFRARNGTITDGHTNGNGYSLVEGGGPQLQEWGFLDPIDLYFDDEYRPPYPAAVVSSPTDSKSGYRSCSTHRQRRASADSDAEVVPPQLLGSSRLTAKGFQFVAGDAWYQLPTAEEAPQEWVLAYDAGAWGAPICVGEEPRVGREWVPPARGATVDLRFGPNDLGADGDVVTLTNWIRGELPGRFTGSASLVPPYEDLLANFCDQTAELDGSAAIEIQDSGSVGFRNGVHLEAALRLDSKEDQSLISKWDDGDEQWKLAIENEELVFTVRLDNDEDLTASWPLPAPQCCDADDPLCDDSCTTSCNVETLTPRSCFSSLGYRRWTHVAAVSDPSDEGMLKLYWDGRLEDQVAQTERLAAGDAVVRIGAPADGLDGRIDNVMIWAPEDDGPAAEELDLVFAIDTTGSMSDDIAEVRSSTTEIIDAIAEAGSDFRVAITAYRDFPVTPYGSDGDYPYRVFGDFSTDRDAIVGAVNALTTGGGFNFPESGYSGTIGSMRRLVDDQGQRLSAWRTDARKALVIMTDAPAHDPEPFTNYTIADVLQAALDGGIGFGDPTAVAGDALKMTGGAPTPIAIYGILIGGDPGARATLEAMAGGTGGLVFEAATAGDVVEAILGAIGSIGGPTGIVYGVDDRGLATSQIFRLDLATGEITLLGGELTDLDLESIVLDPASGELYTIASLSGEIYRVDRDTGDLTYLATIDNVRKHREVAAAGFHPEGELWIYHKNIGLETVDLADGSTERRWGHPWEGEPRKWDAIAWHPSGSALYAAQRDVLYLWDPESAEKQELCGGAGFLPDKTEALDFDATGRLIGASDDRLFVIVPESCALTELATVDGREDIEGLAFVLATEDDGGSEGGGGDGGGGGGGDGGGGSCSCSGRSTFWGSVVDPAATFCGFTVCGSDNQLVECGESGWTAIGDGPCDCRCFAGVDASGNPIDPDHTYCGFEVCGLDLQIYECRTDGWQALGTPCS